MRGIRTATAFLGALTTVLFAAACGSSPASPPPPPPPVPPAAPSAPGVPATQAQAADPGPPAGYVSMHAVRVAPTPEGDAVLLGDASEAILIPIFIGQTEALSIHLRLTGQPPERPLTHDLLDSVLRQVETRIVNVRVDKIQGSIFMGTVVFQQGARTFSIDARPSDAIAMAVGNRVPIYVATDVVRAAGVLSGQPEGPAPSVPIQPTL